MADWMDRNFFSSAKTGQSIHSCRERERIREREDRRKKGRRREERRGEESRGERERELVSAKSLTDSRNGCSLKPVQVLPLC